MVIIIMGVSGSGKTTVGRLLAGKLELPYFDADDFHSASSINKMKKGTPLTDKDREPWLQRLADMIAGWDEHGGAVLACSALKEKYRKLLASKLDDILWVHLAGSFELIRARIEARKQHYMSPVLLQSQFDTLEVPAYALPIDISASPEKIVEGILTKIDAG